MSLQHMADVLCAAADAAPAPPPYRMCSPDEEAALAFALAEPLAHELKTDAEVFGAIFRGEKTYTMRYNDRNFRVGDRLILRRTVHSGEAMRRGAPLEYAGGSIERTVSHILAGYGLKPGWVCLSFRR